MLPKHHLIAGVIAATILFPLFRLNSLLVLITIVVIDIDHFFIYLWRFKKFDFKNAYNYFKKVKDGGIFYPVFHMFETFAVILFFALYLNCMFLELVAIGMIVHITHDLIEELFLRPTNRNFFMTGLIIKK